MRRRWHATSVSLGALLLAAAIGGPGLAVAQAEASSTSLEANLEVEGGAAYLKQPLKLKLIFRNRTQTPITIGPEAFSPDAFAVVNPRGRPRTARAGHSDDPTGTTPDEPLTVPGLGPAERVVDLSGGYPDITSRRGTWEIRWMHGDWSSEPIRVVVIEPYDRDKDLIAILETDLGRVTWRLMPEYAPEHVKHFVDLARQGHYDGLTFHRYIPQMQAEGGDPSGDGTGGWERLLPAEFAADLVPQTGFVGALRRESSMSSDTIFFIILNPSPAMRGLQTFFAKVTDGYEVIARMNQIPRAGETGRNAYLLKEPVRIHRIRIK